MSGDHHFDMKGRMPDFAARREPFQPKPASVTTEGPDWTAGKHEVVVAASSSDFRRYLLKWSASDGSEYTLDMVLLRGESGISKLTKYTPFNGSGTRKVLLFGAGTCDSKFPAERGEGATP